MVIYFFLPRSSVGKKPPRAPANTPAAPNRLKVPNATEDGGVTPWKNPAYVENDASSEDEDPDACSKEKLSFKKKKKMPDEVAEPDVLAFRLNALNLASYELAPGTPKVPYVVKASSEDFRAVEVGVTPDEKGQQLADNKAGEGEPVTPIGQQRDDPKMPNESYQLGDSPSSPIEVVTDNH